MGPFCPAMHRPVETGTMATQEPLEGSNGRLRLAGFAVLGLLLAGLAGRILSFPLNRDENLFVTVAAKIGTGDIYRDLGYNHLPNMPYLLGLVYEVVGTSNPLLTARVLLVGFWLLAIASIWKLSRQLSSGSTAFLAASLVLVCNTMLLTGAGTLATNNFIPVALVFPAFALLVSGIERDSLSPAHLFLAGLIASLAIGFKANYVFIAPFFALAILIAPNANSLKKRLVRGLLPLAAGGIIGGLPTLAHMLSDPDAFFAHTLSYFMELHPAYWADADLPKAVGIKDKILLAERMWLGNTSLLALVIVGTMTALVTATKGVRALTDWKVIVVAGMALCGFVVSFVPTPSFDHYYVPPLPFLVLLILILAGKLAGEHRRAVTMLMASAAVLCVLNATPRLAGGLASFASTGSWETLRLARDVQSAGATAGLEEGDRIATLSPVLALEGGYSIYPEFAAGQFVYRVAPYMTDEDREFYRTTSPAELARFLDAQQPKAILVNREEEMEADLAEYARLNGYERVGGPDSGNSFDLYVAGR